MQNSNLSENFELKDPSATPDSRDPNTIPDSGDPSEVSQTRVASTGVESILGDTAKTPVSETTPIVCIQVFLQFCVRVFKVVHFTVRI